MTFAGLVNRLAFIALLAGILSCYTQSWSWALYLAAMPVIFHEMLRPR